MKLTGLSPRYVDDGRKGIASREIRQARRLRSHNDEASINAHFEIIDGRATCSPAVSDPPNLPPFLKGPHKPRREIFIMPDVTRLGTARKTQFENCFTIHYFWMTRVEGLFEKVWCTPITSRVYRQWLETYEMKNDIPPHIAFGGAIKSVPGGDPEFYNRWAAYAKKMFC